MEKLIIKRIFIWLGLSILMMIFWIIGLMIATEIFPSDMMQSSENSDAGVLILFLISLLNTGVILYFIYSSHCRGWKLVSVIFLFIFGIQYFMAQIESLWFNSSLGLGMNSIKAIVGSGIIMALLFSITATLFTGKFKSTEDITLDKIGIDTSSFITRVLFLAVLVWPLIYFLAGYFIAWQFPEVRMLYSGTTEKTSFISIMKENFSSGLYYFQILRGILWILIGLPVLIYINGSGIYKGFVFGLLLMVLGSSQLLLPNPVMTDMVRYAHLIETSTSDFIWGFIIGWTLDKSIFVTRKVEAAEEKY